MNYSFEFDENTSSINRAEHGIDSGEAQQLWLDDELLRIPSRYATEVRFLFIGKIENRHWSAVVTYRGETIRMISVRRSRVREVEAYEGQ